jgi:hypothetical protein
MRARMVSYGSPGRRRQFFQAFFETPNHSAASFEVEPQRIALQSSSMNFASGSDRAFGRGRDDVAAKGSQEAAVR